MAKNIVSKIKDILGKTPFNDPDMSLLKEKLPLMKEVELREILDLLKKRERIIDDSSVLLGGIYDAKESGDRTGAGICQREDDNDIAIIGLNIRSSLANDYRDFWKNLMQGLDCTRNIPLSRKGDLDQYFDYINGQYGERFKKEYLKIGYLDDIDKFDYRFFGITPRDAQLLDPNQRLFLEAAYAAIEDAGQAGSIRGSKTGVFAGYNSLKATYFSFINTFNGTLAKRSILGNLDAVIPSRVSHYFNFKGPGLLVNTTCSSVLVALHLACRSIRNGECSQAVVGGVQINIMPLHERPLLGIESADGLTRPFDEKGDGTNFCEGVGAVFIKPLKRAVIDGDHVYAVIRGSAINHDGQASNIAAPNLLAQKDVIRAAWVDAGIDPASLSYIEAHGTGTKLGDPIEVEALTQAFAENTDKKQFCAIGSLKSNFGHAAASSGLFGLVKAALSLKNKEIPATIHFHEPNGKIDWPNSALYVNTELNRWKRTRPQEPLLCGVSSFGISGTNCHVVLEEATAVRAPKIRKENRKQPEIFVISAKDKSALGGLIRAYYNFLIADLYGKNAALADICYTAAVGREHHDHRLAIIVKDKKDLVNKLKNLLKFDFSDTINHAAGVFYAEHRSIPFTEKEKGGKDIGELRIISLSKEINEKIGNSSNKKSGAKKVFLGRIAESYIKGAGINWPLPYKDRSAKKISLPTYPFARTRCWIEPLTGQTPDKFQETQPLHPLFREHITESKDQDVFMSEIDPGKYFFVSEHKVRGDITFPGTAYLEMAKQIGLYYYEDSPVELKKIFFLAPMIFKSDREVRVVRVRTKKQDGGFSFAIHSKLKSEDAWLAHVTGELRLIGGAGPDKFFDINKLKKECGRKLKSSFYESLGKKDGETVYGPRWQCFRDLREGNGQVLVELILPEKYVQDLDTYYIHPALWDMATFAKGNIRGLHVVPFLYDSIKIYSRTPKHIYCRIWDNVKNGPEDLKKKALAGYDMDLMDASGRVFARISGYFMYNQVFLKGAKEANYPFHRLSWHKEPLKAGQEKVSGASLLFGDGNSLAAALKKRTGSENLIIVSPDKEYRKKSKNEYSVGPAQKDYDRLFAELKKKKIKKIIHAFTLSDSWKTKEIGSLSDLNESQERGVLSLFRLTKALQNNGVNEKIDLTLLTGLAEAATGKEEALKPENATLVGLGKAVTLENPNIRCRSIDIDDKTKIGVILDEVFSVYSVYKTAYRNNTRYIEVLDKFDMEKASKSGVKIKPGGVYLITGGTGGIGLTIAKYLSSQNKIKLALISRGGLRAKGKKADKKDKDKAKIIEEIRRSGSEVMVIAADVTDEKKMKEAIGLVRKKLGRINGVVHAAGVAGDGFIILKKEEIFKSVLAPKVKGAWLLGRLTDFDDLDFFMNFSSVASVFSSQGQGDYTAANAYLDSFSACRSTRKKKEKNLSINWCSWQEIGMAVDKKTKIEHGIVLPVKTDGALALFKQAMEKEAGSGLMIGRINYNHPRIKAIDGIVNFSSNIKKFLDFQSFYKDAGEININSRVPEIRPASIENRIMLIWREILGYDQIDIDDNFFELGGDSLAIVQVHKELEKIFPGKISVAQVFSYPTIRELASYLDDGKEDKPQNNSEHHENQSVSSARDMAIIGMSIKTSFSENVRDFWVNIIRGKNLVRSIPTSRKKDVDDYYAFKFSRNKSEMKIPYNKMAYIEEIDKFDYGYFKMSPKEAQLMDPNQRLFLESAFAAIEDAGQIKKISSTATGFYVGFSHVNKGYDNMISEVMPEDHPGAILGNFDPMMSGRASYLLNAQGPSLLVNTACSSSLVALHLACRAILNGDCNQAVVSGVKVILLPVDGPRKVGIESSDGLTRSFDEQADGTSWSEAVASVFIKPLRDAVREGDNIYAVIKGSAVNQDGASASIAAPNSSAQANVLISAWRDARIDPLTISYIEAHGTGTKLGDPIEVEGMAKAFGKYTDRKNFCPIGSIKSNVGHTAEASGLLGVIKAALSLKHRVVPPSIHFKNPNSRIDWKNAPVYVNKELRPWDRIGPGAPLRCGISSFGFSGTNCHVVLEEAPPNRSPEIKQIEQAEMLFLVSARNKESLRGLLKDYLDFFVYCDTIPDKTNTLKNICYTAASARLHYDCRLAIIVEDKDSLRSMIKNLVDSGLRDINSHGPIFFNDHPLGSLADRSKDMEETTSSANKLLSGSDGFSRLKDLASLYVRGADPDWNALYSGLGATMISLPTYSFERTRAWLDIPGASEAFDEIGTRDLFHRLSWHKEPLKAGQEKVSGASLLFGDGNSLAAALKKRTGSENLIIVSPDKEYRKKSKNEYSVGPAQKDYDRLFAELKKKKIKKIIHAFTLSDSWKTKEIGSLSDLNESQERGVLSLFRLTKALQNNGVNEKIDLTLLTGLAEAATGKEEALKPENATLVGLGKAVTLENPNIRCRSIDIDDKTKIGVILDEVFSVYSVYKTAYRNNTRYIEVLDKFDMEKASKSGVKIKPGGVYLITGGTGGIGLTIAKYLSSQNKIKLALISRGGLRAKGKKADKKDKDKAKIIEEIRRSGSEVMVIAADVTDEKKMKEAIGLVRKKLGRINGVVHAAGKSAYGLIKDINPEEFGREFNSKVQGTWLLGKMCAKDNLDFMVLFSSTSTIVGWRGFAGKTSANTYIDSYVQYFNKAKRVVSIHWPTWDNIVVGSLNREFLSLKNLFAFEVSESLLSEIGTRTEFPHFDIFRKRQDRISASENSKAGMRGGTRRDLRSELTSIWQRVLGYKDISANDNFFELGGDSIMIIRVQTMIGQRLEMNIPVIEIFNRPTISALVDFMEKFRTAKEPTARSIKVAKPYKSIDKN